jgi:hypothetical protein
LLPFFLRGRILNSLSLSLAAAMNYLRLLATLNPASPLFINLTSITPVLTL